MTGRIENDVFMPIAGLLRGPAGVGRAARFHFTVLEGYRGRIATLGADESGDPVGDDSPVDQILGTRIEALRAAGRLDRANLIQDLMEQGQSLEVLEKWSASRMRQLGQRIAATPSRVEQCLAIAAATEIEGDRFESAPFWRDGFFKIDQYLDESRALDADWAKAIGVLSDGAIPPQTVPALEEGTAPFLIAEYLQFRRDNESLHQLRERLDKNPPGLVVLPFKIFGQYRAAGVWIYAGSLDDASDLMLHIQDMARKMAGWITPAIEKAASNAVVLSMLEALYRHEGDESQPLIACEHLRQSIFDLLFTTGGTVRDDVDREGRVEFPETGVLGALKRRRVHFVFGAEAEAASEEEEIQRLLGCKSIELDCPMLLSEADFADAQAKLRAVLRPFEAGVSRAAAAMNHRRSREEMRIRESFQKRLAAISSEMVLAHNDLAAISAGWAAQVGPASTGSGFQVVRHLNEKLLCYAAAAQNLSQGQDAFNLTICSRTEADTEFFADYFLSVAQLVAFSERWQILQGRKDAHDLVLMVDIKGPQAGVLVTKRYTIDEKFVPKAAPDPTHLVEMPWPLPREDPLNSDPVGGMSPLLLGPMGLLRTACRTAAQVIRDRQKPETVTLVVELSREEHRWTFMSTVEFSPGNDNPEFDVLSDSSLRLIADLVAEGSFDRLPFDRDTGTTRLRHELSVQIPGRDVR